ncbi:hypothetical protein GQ457_04G020660 [Hibiscus cannabinus]
MPEARLGRDSECHQDFSNKGDSVGMEDNPTRQDEPRNPEGAIEEKESRNNHRGPKLAWSIDLEIDSSLSSSSSLVTCLLIMLVMTCTLVSGVGGLEMHLEAELHIFGRLIQSNWVVKVTNPTSTF